MDGKICHEMDIPTKSNRVDIGVRVELPAVIFHILQMNYTRVKSYTGHGSLKIMSVLSV